MALKIDIPSTVKWMCPNYRIKCTDSLLEIHFIENVSMSALLLLLVSKVDDSDKLLTSTLIHETRHA